MVDRHVPQVLVRNQTADPEHYNCDKHGADPFRDVSYFFLL